MPHYWKWRGICEMSEEEARRIRREIFTDDLSGKILLPEDTIYHSDATEDEDTLNHLGNVTRPLPLTKMTQKLPALKIKTLKKRGK